MKRFLIIIRRLFLLAVTIIGLLFVLFPIEGTLANGLILFVTGGAALFLFTDFVSDGKIDGDFDQTN